MPFLGFRIELLSSYIVERKRHSLCVPRVIVKIGVTGVLIIAACVYPFCLPRNHAAMKSWNWTTSSRSSSSMIAMQWHAAIGVFSPKLARLCNYHGSDCCARTTMAIPIKMLEMKTYRGSRVVS